MNKAIRSAAVIGSGVMGAAIAAHLANVGIPCMLLDIVPNKLTEEEEKKGLTIEHPAVRNRLASAAIEKLKKTNPAPLYSESFASRITPGNIEDHLDKLSAVDWVVEVVVERLDIKQSLLKRIESVWKPGTIVSTNTSGISVNAMTEGLSDEFKAHFLGTHFFNPPRYMKLLEIIPGERTNPEIIEFMKSFCEKKLGKGVVVAKDTPNFIANRIGTYGLLVTLQEMERGGYCVEEVDAVSGPAMGRPKSATFRTLDLVGIDTFVHVAANVRENVSNAAEQAVFTPPAVLTELVSRGWIGDKSGKGFYQKTKGPSGSVIQALQLDTMEYAPSRKISGASLEAAKAAKGVRERLKALLSTQDRYSDLAWNVMKHALIYSAEKLGEIADSIVDIDNAMKWGFNWDLGPFETWDAIGLKRSLARMEAEGLTVPAWVRAWVAAGNESFYKPNEEGKSFAYVSGEYRGVEVAPEQISLSALKKNGKVVRSNSGASLIDIGDDVVCLEFHSPNNAIGADILTMINQSVDEVRANWRGLVIANQGKNFCVGANLMMLLMEAQDGEWDEVDGIIRFFHKTMMNLKSLEKPVVAAPHRMTLGGGVEVCLPADQINFSSETYFGLVEVGVGLIPGGGGLKETALRIHKQTKGVADADLQPYVNHAFETIAMAKVSTSGYDTERLGYMKPNDRVVVNPDHLIYEAKQSVLHMDAEGYTLPQQELIRVVGSEGKAILKLAAFTMRQGGYITDHDVTIAGKLANVLAGGDVPAGTMVSEQYLLDLEREAFLSLCGEPKTQARMQHMLATGKPLRN